MAREGRQGRKYVRTARVHISVESYGADKNCEVRQVSRRGHVEDGIDLLAPRLDTSRREPIANLFLGQPIRI